MGSEAFDLRNKTMVKILKPLIHKVVELNSYRAAGHVYSESEARDICCIMEGIHTNLLQLPEFNGSVHIETLKVKLKAALDDFYAAYGLMQSEVDNRTAATSVQVQMVCKNLVHSIYEILLFEDSLLNSKVQVSLLKCKSILCNLQAAKHNNIITEFKAFVEEILNCREPLNAFALNLVTWEHRNLILLCVSQIQKCISLMFKMYKSEGWTNTFSSKESGSYLFSRIQRCFSEMLGVINFLMPREDEMEESDNQFTPKMNLVLEMLSSIKVEEFNNIIPQVRHVVRKLLSCAMAIAEVSVANDSANITESCQKVIYVLENIRKESESDRINLSVRQLHYYSLVDALESLEEQINNTLLRLVLKVFSEPYTPLKELVQVSCSIPVTERCAEDLKDLISVLDLHEDRIVQIGMFATGCSRDARRILGIRSCLESLKSLEDELVPALTAYYLNHNRSSHRNHLKMLSDHWQSEVLELEELIDGIVDPAAFCEVTLNEVHQMVATLKISLYREKPFLKTLLNGICKKSLKLVKHLRVSTSEMMTYPSELKMEQMVDDLYRACKECSAVTDVFLSESQSDEDSVCRSRLLKRCKLIVSCMKKLQPHLLDLVNHTDPLKDAENYEFSSVNAFKNQGDTFIFPESIHGVPMDTSHSSSETECMLTDDVAEIEMKLEDTHLNSATALPPCLEMGRKLHQENSSLYQQIPKENHQKSSRTQKRLFSRNESVNVDKHVETSLLHFSVDDSLGLEVTGILENLTLLSSTSVTFNVSNAE